MNSAMLAVIAAFASFVFVFLLFSLIYITRRMAKSRPRRPPIPTRAVPKPDLSSIAVDESASFDPSLRISMADLVVATKNFSADLVIGDGSFGLVYKAELSSGVTVAIKKLHPDAFQGFREFRAEMDTLGKLRHRNIVKILGYCASGAERLLVYEFVERGSLDQCLYDTSSEEEAAAGDFRDTDEALLRLPLPWDTRIKIVRGVANGLAYLHGLEKPIIHRDIKASNVLLDHDFEARIADFGLARRIDTSHTHVSTQVAGTMGYMPPEYKNGVTAATVKVDVYSFGILMLEIAMGRRPNLPMSIDGKEMGLVEWVDNMVAQNREMAMVDPNISKEGLSEAVVKEYFRIACVCTRERSRERPPMADVVEMLDRLPT